MKIILNGFAPQYGKGLEEFSAFHNFDAYDAVVEASNLGRIGY